ncbi:hypothetical protein [Butyrivibrio sp. NC3005]|uniref:hypothetical protein n=1 Tax=Butyrivibrio sp. NC3005 TaxID=1280685 RepID=UPI000427BBE2|nr:hypothetical protein [Butyrivibrio sp. NC3005]
MNKLFEIICSRVIKLMCFLIIGVVFVVNLFWGIDLLVKKHTEKLIFTKRNAIEYLLGVIIVAIAVLLISEFIRHLTRKNKKLANIVVFFSATIVFIESVIWMKNAMFYPIADPSAVWQAATHIAKGELDSIDYFYFQLCPHQRGMVLIMLPFAFIGRNHVRGWIAYKLFNCVLTFGITMVVARISFALRKKEEDKCMGAVICILFLPIAMYASYVYGTICSLFFLLTAFYFGIFVFLSNRKFRYALLSLFCMFFSNISYSGAAIGIVAIIIILSVHLFSDKQDDKIAKKKELILIVLSIFVMLFSGRIAGKTFEIVTDSETNPNSIPISCYLMMGLNSETEIGPGGYDGSHLLCLYAHECDKKKADKIGIEKSKEAIKNYIHNPKKAVGFFGKKIIWQWADPTFGAVSHSVYINGVDEVQVSPRFVDFIAGNTMKMILRMLGGVCGTIYLLNLIFISGKLIKEKEYHIGYLVLGIFFIGGFVFQLFWESKSRYCFPYMVAIIPYASVQVNMLRGWIKKCCYADKKRKL